MDFKGKPISEYQKQCLKEGRKKKGNTPEHNRAISESNKTRWKKQSI